MIVILGGPQYRTLEVAVYENAVRLFDLPAAAALALLQLAAVVAILLVTGGSNDAGLAHLDPRRAPRPRGRERLGVVALSSSPSRSPSSRSRFSSSVRSGRPTGTVSTGSVRSATRHRRSSSSRGGQP